MEHIEAYLEETLKTALKEHNSHMAEIIRGLRSVIHNARIEAREKGSEIEDSDIIVLLKRELKKRHESAEMFEKGGATERAEKEKKEAAFIETLLPPQLSQEELEAIVQTVLQEHPDATQKDMGMLIKAVLEKAGDGADGKRVSEMVKSHLS